MNDRSKAVENERKKRIMTSKTLEAAENELTKVKDDLTITTRERDNVSRALLVPKSRPRTKQSVHLKPKTSCESPKN